MNDSETSFRNFKSKQWRFKLFDHGSLPYFDEEKMNYLIYGRRICSNTNRKYFQGYVYFKKRHYITGVQKVFPEAEIERARGTFKENIEYIMKCQQWEEFGESPTVTNGGSRFAQVLKFAESGDMDSVKKQTPGIYIRYKKTLESLCPPDVEALESFCGVWIYGPEIPPLDDTVIENFSPIYIKSISKWWDGYRSEENVLISDVKPSNANFLVHFLKIWTNRFPFQAEYKGTSRKIRPKRIFVTSSYKLEKIFYGNILNELKFRFDLVDYNFIKKTYIYTPKAVSKTDQTGVQVLKELLKTNLLASKDIIVEVPEKAIEAGPSFQRTIAEMESLGSDVEEYENFIDAIPNFLTKADRSLQRTISETGSLESDVLEWKDLVED